VILLNDDDDVLDLRGRARPVTAAGGAMVRAATGRKRGGDGDERGAR